MKFSILIAHYNHWNYFQECYLSIKNQTFQDFEIIIVDDCSTDGSYQKLQELALTDSKIKLFQNPQNKKVGFTKRRCVEEANGELCGFLDPDDRLAPNALELSVNAYNFPNIVATYSKIKLIDKNSNEIGDFKNSKKLNIKNKLFFNVNFEVAHFFTFSKATYNKTSGIKSDLIVAEDQDLYLKLYEQGDFYFLEDYLYYYRMHEAGISQNKNKSEKQKKNWHDVIYDACKRRDIEKLYGKKIADIDNLPYYILKNENTVLKRIKRKINTKINF